MVTLYSRMTVSICVVRKSDKKCLHLLTDVGVADIDIDTSFLTVMVKMEDLIVQSR